MPFEDDLGQDRWHHWLDGHEFEKAPGHGTGKAGVLQSRGSQRDGHDWKTELTVLLTSVIVFFSSDGFFSSIL